MGILIAIVLGIASIVFFWRGIYSFYWRSGPGPAKARAEYGRISREAPDSADAKISEAEYVDKFVSSRASGFKNFAYALLLIVVGVPLSIMFFGT